MKRNARFWIFHRGGWVKLTLRPGERLTVATHSTDCEGWSRDVDTYQHDGGELVRDYFSEGRDCDGYIRQGALFSCPLSRLTARDPYRPNPYEERNALGVTGIPDWQEIETAPVFDEYAQAAGY